MGLFDAFTGKPATDAAAANSALIKKGRNLSLDALTTGREGALGALTTAGGIYGGIGEKYGAGTDLYLDSLGVNGAAGNANAVNAFQTGPGYDFAVNQSLDALDRRASSRGMLGSGNTSLDTLTTVNGLANQEYGNWQTKLAGLINPEITGVSGQAGAEAAKAPVWTNDANARAGVYTGAATGMAGQNTQAANAAMQGNANMWGLGLNALKLGTGMLGGGVGGGAAAPAGYNWNGTGFAV